MAALHMKVMVKIMEYAYNGGSNFGSKGFINYTVDFSQQNNAVRSGIIDSTN